MTFSINIAHKKIKNACFAHKSLDIHRQSIKSECCGTMESQLVVGLEQAFWHTIWFWKLFRESLLKFSNKSRSCFYLLRAHAFIAICGWQFFCFNCITIYVSLLYVQFFCSLKPADSFYGHCQPPTYIA